MARAKTVDQVDSVEIERVISLLGGAQNFPDRPHGPLAAHRLIEQGLPSSALFNLLDNLEILGDDPTLQQALGISIRTAQRKKAMQTVLTGVQSGRTWKFTQILSKAIDVFGSQADAERWLDEPAIGLEGYRPIQLLSTPAGVDLVEEFLDRLAFGVYA